MQKVSVQLIDDLDGSVIDGNGGPITIHVDGKGYELDLSDANREKLEKALKPFLDVARTTSTSRSETLARKRRRTGQQDYGPLREWAKANGYTVSERGRVPASVIEAYEAAH